MARCIKCANEDKRIRANKSRSEIYPPKNCELCGYLKPLSQFRKINNINFSDGHEKCCWGCDKKRIEKQKIKRCSACGELKPVNEFKSCKQYGGTMISANCKACINISIQESHIKAVKADEEEKSIYKNGHINSVLQRLSELEYIKGLQEKKYQEKISTIKADFDRIINAIINNMEVLKKELIIFLKAQGMEFQWARFKFGELFFDGEKLDMRLKPDLAYALRNEP